MRIGSVLGVLIVTAAGVTAASAAADNHRTDTTFDLAGDATAGAQVFGKCQACHEIGAGAAAKAGPALNGIVGRPAATYDGFAYSAALTAAATAQDLIWTPQTLDAFLTKPRDFIDGTKMTFIGLRRSEDRADVIAYLATFLEEES